MAELCLEAVELRRQNLLAPMSLVQTALLILAFSLRAVLDEL